MKWDGFAQSAPAVAAGESRLEGYVFLPGVIITVRTGPTDPLIGSAGRLLCEPSFSPWNRKTLKREQAESGKEIHGKIS